jgi:RND family efflux transporter MFP subunit
LALAVLTVETTALGAQNPAPKVVFEASGYVVPVHPVTVSAKVGGQVIELNVKEGDVVKKGQVLARLEDTNYRAELEAAQAKLKLAAIKLAKAKATNENDVAAAKAEVAYAEAVVAKMQWRLDATVIYAPISGTILAKKTEVGNLLQPLAFNLSANVCELADLQDLEVDVAVPERDINKIAKQQACLIRLDAFPKKLYKGQVSRIIPVADRAKGTISVRVKISVPAMETHLWPELRALVQFLDPGS